MSAESQFRFTIPSLPEGEALTGVEIHQRLVEKLNASNGTCRDTLWSLAVFYQQTGHLDQSAACLQRYVDLTADLEELGAAYLALGQMEESRHDYVAAAKRYRAALAMEPCANDTWYFIHNNLGYSLNQTGDHAAAVPYLLRALEIDPAKPNAFKNLGLAHQAMGDLEKAAECFIAATQVNATDGRSLRHLEDLVAAHPAIEVDMPGLSERVETCRQAVALALAQQPDFDAHWARLRASQKPRWWQFWKRHT